MSVPSSRASRALALTAPVAVLLPPADAQAPGKYDSNCDRLHRDFKHGVARFARAARAQVRDGCHPPATTRKATSGSYERNHSRRDRDHDCTGCEA